jgi:hypothetical protein
VATLRQWRPSEIRAERVGDLSSLLWQMIDRRRAEGG